MAEPPRPSPAPTADPLSAWVRRSWLLLAGAIASLAVLLALHVVLDGFPLDLLTAAALGGVAAAALLFRESVDRRDARQRDAVANFARILQGFSRSVSLDGIVDAIVGDLAAGTGADHLVVVRRRPGAPILDATLVSTRPGVPPVSDVLPAADLDEATADRKGRSAGSPAVPATVPADAAAEVVERIADRARRAFGLTNILAAPLAAHGEMLGVIVLSRRRAGPWPESARRLLETAAAEASAALARTATYRAAEAAATTDALTGLPNRRYFEEYVDLLGAGRRADDTVGVLMVDIDRFKLLNDRHGHAVGDVVLRAVARAIAGAVRDLDVPARYGGEEFVVLLRDPSRATALEVGERIRAAVEALDLREAGVERVTVSVGATVGTGGEAGVGELVEAADRALYRAKRFGRNRVEAA